MRSTQATRRGAMAGVLAALGVAVALAAAEDPPRRARVIAWNDLGMHCMDSDYSVFSILPPFNTVFAQLVVDGALVRSADGITVTYEAVADPSGSITTSSAGRTGFWDHAEALYGVALAPDEGLAGHPMPGPGNTPRPMTFDAAFGAFVAPGIPVTPRDDAGSVNRYPMMRIVARDATGVIAETVVVLPVSDEMDCRACHGSDGLAAARPSAGWSYDANPERDYRLNILRLHDDRNRFSPAYAAALVARGLDPGGLHASVTGPAGKPVLCASCHASNALPGTGLAGVTPLTAAMHRRHSWVVDPDTGTPLGDASHRAACYRCHPGSTTQCLRGAMGRAVGEDGSRSMQCQSCHGGMAAVADPARAGWLDQPSCDNCHSGTAVANGGEIRFTSALDDAGARRVAPDRTFATEADAPAEGLSLYRFSRGHGGLACEACHGPTHAEGPSTHASDNLQAIRMQGHAGVLSDCRACHEPTPSTVAGGPHGLHPVGSSRWVEDHGDAVEHGGAAACRTCHGTDYRGTVLSRAQGDRSFSTDYGPRTFWRGFQVGCYACHDGPASESPAKNRAASVEGDSVATRPGTPVAIALRASDADGDALALRVVGQPEHGTVGISGAAATYFPDAGFTGTDAFTFAAWDGRIDSNLGRVSVLVAEDLPVPDLPDLSVGLSSLVIRPARSENGRGTLRVRAEVANLGTLRSVPTTLRAVLSDDGTVDDGDTILRDAPVRALRPGQARSLRLRLRLPRGVPSQGRFLVLALDPGELLPQISRENDVVAAGPMER